ncbi:MAG: NAD(P)H-hydrate epimerase, partial [Burkholderiales bacterium]
MSDRALTLEQIRCIERGALAEGLPLMQRAGAAAAAFAQGHLAPGARILALAGPGNNGGDALVTARLLRALGYAVEVVLPADPGKFPRDAAEAYAQWREAGGVERRTLPDLACSGLPDPVADSLPDLVVDRLP